MSEPVERLCWFCRHFGWHAAEPGYSEMTPGSDWSMECYKRVWSFSPTRDDLPEFRACITKAQTCELFEPSPELPPIRA